MGLILVGGAPGSGKTTLTARLARATGLPSLGRDEVKTALTAAHGSLATDSTEAFYGLIDTFLDRGVSLIAEHTFERGDGRASAPAKVAPIERWKQTTPVVALWCTTSLAEQRADARDGRTSSSSDLPASYWRPPVGLEVLDVDTTAHLVPSIEELAAVALAAASNKRRSGAP